ncbi:hypothetical protein AB0J74_38675 [Asanoa sp. NPDC049573]|uniref:hypothetical protein n=1 Tax=Asanoa sp. NPDC049573 TaxID=3155396 RepID=UPI00344858A4
MAAKSAPLPDLDQWTPEATGSYLVRARATQRAEWWRVVWDCVVKDVGPADPLLPFPSLREAYLDAALTGARGQVDRSLAFDAVNTAMVGNQNRVRGPAGCCRAGGPPARNPMPMAPTTAPRW